MRLAIERYLALRRAAGFQLSTPNTSWGALLALPRSGVKHTSGRKR
jgi:hypothetical protein